MVSVQKKCSNIKQKYKKRINFPTKEDNYEVMIRINKKKS